MPISEPPKSNLPRPRPRHGTRLYQIILLAMQGAKTPLSHGEIYKLLGIQDDRLRANLGQYLRRLTESGRLMRSGVKFYYRYQLARDSAPPPGVPNVTRT